MRDKKENREGEREGGREGGRESERQKRARERESERDREKARLRLCARGYVCVYILAPDEPLKPEPGANSPALKSSGRRGQVGPDMSITVKSVRGVTPHAGIH